MDKLAILGANGFIGTQAVEFFHLQNLFEVRPVVRSFSSLARVARFSLDSKIADATNADALADAFQGCRFVLHAALGDAQVMLKSIDAVYDAAEKAGVERIIYLSSFAVHGLNPPPGTDETAALSTKQRFVYSNAKVAAENRLWQWRQNGKVEVVIFRPGIVYGPRSWRWTAGVADELLAGKAYLANDGSGICNTVYVDNLLEAVRLSMQVQEAVGQAFLVGDEETVTWLEYYKQIAGALGLDSTSIYLLSEEEVILGLKPTKQDVFEHVRALPITQKVLPFVAGSIKTAVKKALFAEEQTMQSGDMAVGIPKPAPQAELLTLQSCRFKLSHEKASTILGYKPLVSYAEGMRRSIAWLKFAGYSVR